MMEMYEAGELATMAQEQGLAKAEG